MTLQSPVATTGPDVSAIAIVGASLAGLGAARRLRELGVVSPIVIFSAEDRLPYDRPPLSKAVLRSEGDVGMVELTSDADIGAFELRLNARVLELDDSERRLRTPGGWSEPFPGGIVIASGSAPRTWKDAPAGVHTLRTHADAIGLRLELAATPRRVVIIGGGFIGAEVAASARALGHEVSVIEVDEIPFARILGDVVGQRITQTHLDHDVTFITGVGVVALQGMDRITGVELKDGRVIPADIAVVGIGVIPEVAWLEGSNVPVLDGVMCDETLLAAPGIVAAGDVANWPNGLTDERRRVEHWDNAIKQGRHAAARLLAEHGIGEPEPFRIMPWVWSDQFEMKLQMAGATRDADEVAIVHGTLESGKFIALYRRGDRLAGAFCMNRARLLMDYRRLLEGGVPWDQAIEHARARTAASG